MQQAWVVVLVATKNREAIRSLPSRISFSRP
jgi:hypothetical protein